jgi:two-component system chemotaxis response regulator CheB
MSHPVQVMVVDDSMVIRRMVASILSQDPAIRVIGSAANGKIAIEQIPLLKPEVIVLDLEMPEIDGFGVLRFLRKEHPEIRTVVFSTLTRRGASQTIEALSLGASDYASKPTSLTEGADENTLSHVTEELIRKVKQFQPGFLASLVSGGDKDTGFSPKTPVKRRTLQGSLALEVAAIGISTGGPEALLKMFPGFSRKFPVPILIVQHMPPLFTKILADRLASVSQIKVVEGADGMAVEKGVAYIAPGNFHMEVQRVRGVVVLSINQDPHENSCRPSADVLFRSVAKVYGGRALGVIMTGMGQDGLKGLKVMKEEGAQVLAQDQASSVVWGMPSFVVRERLADRVVSLSQMSSVIEITVSN